jgi:hypothetical protein
VSLQTTLDLVRPKPEAKWVVFYSLADGPEGGIYYDVHAIEQMRYRLTMLAYDMNGKPLPPDHGAPLRLRNETQLGFKQVLLWAHLFHGGSLGATLVKLTASQLPRCFSITTVPMLSPLILRDDTCTTATSALRNRIFSIV